MSNSPIVIYIHEPGYADAGIRDVFLEWDTGIYEFEGDDHRENVRQHAELLYNQISGVRARISFSNEHPED